MSIPLPEIWKDIKGYENRYQISNFGRVKSLERYVRHCNGITTTVREKIIKINANSKGYCLVTLYKNNKRHTCTVHRLVLTNFKDICDLEINHINGNKKDNRLTNLEFVSNRENINHRECIIRKKKKYGVYFHKSAGKWASKIEYKRKQEHLGLFNNKEEAYQVFYNKYTEYHGVSPW